MFFYVIKLETTMHYITIFISPLLYCRLIITHQPIIIFYSYPLRIDKTSNPYSYSINIRSVFVFGNIRIRIRIRFENVETDMGKALSDPHPIRFHP